MTEFLDVPGGSLAQAAQPAPEEEITVTARTPRAGPAARQARPAESEHKTINPN